MSKLRLDDGGLRPNIPSPLNRGVRVGRGLIPPWLSHLDIRIMTNDAPGVCGAGLAQQRIPGVVYDEKMNL